MTVLKRYDQATDSWVPLVLGKQGPAGPAGPQGEPGDLSALSVQAPITKSGTALEPVIGIDTSFATSKAIAMSIVFGG